MTLKRKRGVAGATKRLDDLRSNLAAVEADFAQVDERLGVAVVDGDESTARSLRSDLDHKRALRQELVAAIPVAERRLREAHDREVLRRRAEAARQSNELRKKRLAAARKVDAAWKTLADAFAELSATEAGAPPEVRMRLARRASVAHQAAAYCWAEQVCRVLGVPAIRRGHRRPLSESEAMTIPEQEVDDEALAG